MTSLRPYQVNVIEELRSAIAAGATRPLLVAPTGSGKTVIASDVIHRAVAKGSKVLFLAHRRELVGQAVDKLAEWNVEAGTILAGEPTEPSAPVQVAGIQTLWTRGVRQRGRHKMALPPADLVVVDEAHRARARTYVALLDRYPEARILGLTATPCRGDGRGLGNVFDTMVECPQVQTLIDEGYLVPTKVFAPSIPDLAGVKVALGDYVEKHLAERVDTPQLVGDIVTHWHRLADRRRTVVFATNVAHSVHLRDEFRKTSVLAEQIDGGTPTPKRDDILARLDRGELELVVNCMVLTEGWDQPAVDCIVLARPTKQMGLFRQMVGRGLRPAPGKTDCLVLDHAGATYMHGFVEEPVEWTLDEDRRAENLVHSARKDGPAASRLTPCSECSAVRLAGEPCRVCGHMPKPKGRSVDVMDGELGELERGGRLRPNEYTPAQRRDFHRQLLGIANQRGYKRGWAAHKFKERFGQWPRDRYVQPATPGPEVTAWARYTAIRYAKRKAKEAANGP